MVFIPNDGATTQQSSYQYTGCVMAVEAVGSGLPEVLLPNATVTADPEHPYVKRLVARGVLVKNVSSCQPTTLSFIPKVALPDDKDRVILRAVLEVNGEMMLNHNGNEGFADIEAFRGNLSLSNDFSAENVAKELFLYSGTDLMRQFGVGSHFDYSPVGDLQSNQLLSIEGREKLYTEITTVDSWHYAPQSINLTLKVIDNLPNDAVDFVKEQWGHDVTVHSCMSKFNMGM